MGLWSRLVEHAFPYLDRAVAKMVATAQTISGGRVILGIVRDYRGRPARTANFADAPSPDGMPPFASNVLPHVQAPR